MNEAVHTISLISPSKSSTCFDTSNSDQHYVLRVEWNETFSDLSRSIRHQENFEPQPENFGWMDCAHWLYSFIDQLLGNTIDCSVLNVWKREENAVPPNTWAGASYQTSHPGISARAIAFGRSWPFAAFCYRPRLPVRHWGRDMSAPKPYVTNPTPTNSSKPPLSIERKN